MKKFDLGDLGAPRRSKALKTQLCDSDPSEHQKTSYTYAKVRKRLFATFLFFEKMKIKLQKTTFALLHTCTAFFGVLRDQNRKVASFAFWSTLALPNRPSRTFSYVYDVFACSESSKSTFCALGAYFEKSRRGPPSATSVRPCVPAGYLGACCVHTPGAVQTPHSARTPGYLGACCAHTPGAMRTPHSARTPGHLGACWVLGLRMCHQQ